MDLFRSQGLQEVTMEAIAARASISKGTLYNYFRDKEEMLAQAAEVERDAFLAAIDEVISSGHGWAKLERLLDFTIRYLRENASLYAVYYRAVLAADDERLDQNEAQGREAFWIRLHSVLEELEQAGELRKGVSATEAALLFGGALRVCVFDPHPWNCDRSAEEQAAELLRLVRFGIGSGPG